MQPAPQFNFGTFHYTLNPLVTLQVFPCLVKEKRMCLPKEAQWGWAPGLLMRLLCLPPYYSKRSLIPLSKYCSIHVGLSMLLVMRQKVTTSPHFCHSVSNPKVHLLTIPNFLQSFAFICTPQVISHLPRVFTHYSSFLFLMSSSLQFSYWTFMLDLLLKVEC